MDNDDNHTIWEIKDSIKKFQKEVHDLKGKFNTDEAENKGLMKNLEVHKFKH
jgi:hypothetical protein